MTKKVTETIAEREQRIHNNNLKFVGGILLESWNNLDRGDAKIVVLFRQESEEHEARSCILSCEKIVQEEDLIALDRAMHMSEASPKKTNLDYMG